MLQIQKCTEKNVDSAWMRGLSTQHETGKTLCKEKKIRCKNAYDNNRKNMTREDIYVI